MDILILTSTILFGTLQTVLKKEYNKKTVSGAFLFNAITSLFAGIFFLLGALDGLQMNLEILPYSIAFAVAYIVASIFTFLAILTGPLGLTSLLVSYSLILPTLYGIIFLNEKVTIPMIIAFVLLVVSIFLTNINPGAEDKKGNLKWLIIVAISFVGNGFCSIFQVAQQNAYNGQYKNEFMILALSIITVALFTFSFITERRTIKNDIKYALPFASACGISNGAVNLFVMILSATMAKAVLFPAISAGGIVMAFLLAKIVYKEKLTAIQYIGAALGVCAVVLLNI